MMYKHPHKLRSSQHDCFICTERGSVNEILGVNSGVFNWHLTEITFATPY